MKNKLFIMILLGSIYILFCNSIQNNDGIIRESLASLKKGNDLENEMSFSNNDSFRVNPNEYFSTELFVVQLKGGETYEVSCRQDISLPSVKRNRFFYEIGDERIYETEDHLLSGRHSWTISIDKDSLVKICLWVYDPYSTVCIDGFLLTELNDPVVEEQDYEELITNLRFNSSNHFLVFSDIHGDERAFRRIIDYADEQGVDAIINCGDTCKQYLNDESNKLDWYYEGINASKIDILSAIGNHDLWDNDNWKRADDKEVYQHILKPLTEKYSGIVRPENDELACYYFKDYGKVRVIIISAMSGDASVDQWDDNQAKWLKQTLDDAIKRQLHVMIVNHAPFPKDIAERDDELSFNSYIDYRKDSGFDDIVMNREALNIIKNYTDSGGVLISLFSGHNHVDNILTANGYDGLFMVNLACANHSMHFDGSITDDYRDKRYNCFDYVGIDTVYGILKLIRVGWSVDSSLKERVCLSYNYFDGSLICN